MPFLPENDSLIELDVARPIWDHFYTVAPLVVIGTKERANYNLAPKHMATPLGMQNYFGFVCTPAHATYHNVKKEKSFTVSFPKPDQVVLASLAALPRCGSVEEEKYIIKDIPTFPAKKIEAPFLQQAYLFLECTLHKIVDDFGQHSLIAGEIVAAYIDENYLRSFEKDDQTMIYKWPMLVYLAYGRFATIQSTNVFPFPKNFKK